MSRVQVERTVLRIQAIRKATGPDLPLPKPLYDGATAVGEHKFYLRSVAITPARQFLAERGGVSTRLGNHIVHPDLKEIENAA
jgi:hypothetical protein